MYNYVTVGTTIQSPSNVTYLPGVTPLPIELTCDVPAAAAWRVNSTDFTFPAIMGGMPSGYNVSGDNILIITPVNNTNYNCVNRSTVGEPYYVFVAGECQYLHKLFHYIGYVRSYVSSLSCQQWIVNISSSSKFLSVHPLLTLFSTILFACTYVHTSLHTCILNTYHGSYYLKFYSYIIRM